MRFAKQCAVGKLNFSLRRTFFFRGKWQQFCNEIIDQLSNISMELFVSCYGFTSANACFISPLFGLLIYVTSTTHFYRRSAFVSFFLHHFRVVYEHKRAYQQ